MTIVFKDEYLKVILDSICAFNHLTYDIIGRNIAISRLHNNINIKKDSVIYQVPEIISYYKINGRVIDVNTKIPVSFANIYIKNKAIGTISNYDGYFTFKIPIENVSDSIYFSCLGYNTASFQINKLPPEYNYIALSSKSIDIKEVNVNYIAPHEILKEAIKNISSNYSKVARINTAFYRELVRENSDYVNLSEAILSIYKAPYNSYSNDQVVILKGRKSPFLKPMDTLSFKFQGGPNISLLLDIAKNPSYFMSDEFIKYYDFKLVDIGTINDRAVYNISFDQKEYSPYALYKGNIYIDRRTMAFVRFDFTFSPKGIDEANHGLVLKSPRKVKVKLMKANYLVNYNNQNNVWSLSNVREEILFTIHKKLTFFTKNFYIEANLVITKTDTTEVHRFNNHDIIHQKDVFVEKLGKYDENFWGDYNILKPDESIEEALKQVGLKINSLHYSN
jgi:hypothetical protein